MCDSIILKLTLMVMSTFRCNDHINANIALEVRFWPRLCKN
jgi:hypothetical protein